MCLIVQNIPLDSSPVSGRGKKIPKKTKLQNCVIIEFCLAPFGSSLRIQNEYCSGGNIHRHMHPLRCIRNHEREKKRFFTLLSFAIFFSVFEPVHVDDEWKFAETVWIVNACAHSYHQYFRCASLFFHHHRSMLFFFVLFFCFSFFFFGDDKFRFLRNKN